MKKKNNNQAKFESGFKCNYCKFETEQAGYAGRQAMRAHWKRHKRELRQLTINLAIGIMFLATMVGLTVAGSLGLVDWDIDLGASKFPSWLSWLVLLSSGGSLPVVFKLADTKSPPKWRLTIPSVVAYSIASIPAMAAIGLVNQQGLVVLLSLWPQAANGLCFRLWALSTQHRNNQLYTYGQTPRYTPMFGLAHLAVHLRWDDRKMRSIALAKCPHCGTKVPFSPLQTGIKCSNCGNILWIPWNRTEE